MLCMQAVLVDLGDLTGLLFLVLLLVALNRLEGHRR